jgi:hypothetical protein
MEEKRPCILTISVWWAIGTPAFLIWSPVASNSVSVSHVEYDDEESARAAAELIAADLRKRRGDGEKREKEIKKHQSLSWTFTFTAKGKRET